MANGIAWHAMRGFFRSMSAPVDLITLAANELYAELLAFMRNEELTLALGAGPCHEARRGASWVQMRDVLEPCGDTCLPSPAAERFHHAVLRFSNAREALEPINPAAAVPREASPSGFFMAQHSSNTRGL